jgi:hypothetical protein
MDADYTTSWSDCNVSLLRLSDLFNLSACVNIISQLQPFYSTYHIPLILCEYLLFVCRPVRLTFVQVPSTRIKWGLTWGIARFLQVSDCRTKDPLHYVVIRHIPTFKKWNSTTNDTLIRWLVAIRWLRSLSKWLFFITSCHCLQTLSLSSLSSLPSLPSRVAVTWRWSFVQHYHVEYRSKFQYSQSRLCQLWVSI